MADNTKKKHQQKLTRDSRVEELETQLIEKDTAHKRALADYQNLQKNTREEHERFAKMASALLIQELLVPIDHLEMAVAHMKDTSLELIHRQFMQVLEREGVKEIETLGKTFDPHTMDAIDTETGEKDKVIRVAQKGYTISGVILRPAKVIVGKGESDDKNSTKEKVVEE
ncbi:MAG TPA: nucleotide exchange factor GrpE [Candidatus Pacebacteria bacterium]|nr:MAG: Protein GrpE [Microgenomates group bacterium GW2011_GWB1_45_17]KKU23386.1 MAG: Protein GrpE [Microgenomates group bacterium GW2011_GWA1_46_15]KKU24484.1 MAG: Protein GrpE [Microgenomates group bacterium GW2011_GWC1_46_15]HAV15588.1 nucleotide exchange factor GrpE [Candidatus Paceibacterota bacterium]HCR10914.1 nucleotide exchange factor GrpE [Candidatus Paceibacterota bacterium]